MDEFKRIKMSLFLVLLLQSTAAVKRQPSLFFTVRVGEEVTLPCSGVRDDQDGCNDTDWTFNHLGPREVHQVKRGQIVEEAKAKSDRLSVAENCSLGIQEVREEDAGRYICTQIRSGRQQGEDAHVYLTVVSLTQHQDNDEVTLRCSVLNNAWCRHTVKWLFQGQDVDKDLKDMNTSESHYEASVTFLTSHVGYRSGLHLFTCQLTDDHTGEVFLFPFSTPSSGLLRLIVVSVGLATLIMIVVAVNIWTRIKEEKTQMEEISVRYDVDDGTVN